MAVYRSRGNFTSTAISNSWTLPAASGTQNGDLLVIGLALQETIVGGSALIRRPTGFTDLFTDGFNPGPGFGLQYVLDPGGGTGRLFVYAGYRFAASEPANYAISSSGFSFGLQGDVYAYALPGDLLATSLIHSDDTINPVPTTTVVVPSVTLDVNHRTLVCLVHGGLMASGGPDGYNPPVPMTGRANDGQGGVPENWFTLADEVVAGSGASSGTRTFTSAAGTVTCYCAVGLSIGGTVASGAGRLPLLGAG